jgi:hypothetical protein
MEDEDYIRARRNLTSANGPDAVESFGTLVDEADVRGHQETLEHLLKEATRIRATLEENSFANCSLDYYVGNALSVLHRRESAATDTVLAWAQPRLRHAIFHYRRAALHVPSDNSARSRGLQIAVNLGNAFSHVGRSFDAIEQYDRAIDTSQTFGMAIGNRGFAFMHLARCMGDPSHQFLATRHAWVDMRNAIQANSIEPDAAVGFKKAIVEIESWAGTEKLQIEPEWPTTSIGTTKEEREYRTWCYRHRLFVNDAADFLPATVSASDVTSLPSIVSPIQSPVQLYGLFNLMKQEFVTARWLAFAGLTAKGSHFADREVLIYDTLDYPCHSISIDQIRIAVRAAFSVFDKVGLFINQYWDLGHEPSQVYFRSVWYEKRDPKKGLHQAFEQIHNWPLRGLYWISLDLVDKEMQEILEPESRSLQELRHKLEHQFVKIVEPMSAALHGAKGNKQVMADPAIVMYVARQELGAKAIRVLQLVRRALLHLSMAVQVEEERRARDRGEQPIGKIEMLPYPDEWKH